MAKISWIGNAGISEVMGFERRGRGGTLVEGVALALR